MRGRWLPIAFALAGCDTVVGAERVYECPPTGDEDCDALLDEVDPCPSDRGNKADADGDGVGNACDPDVEAAIDSLVEFEGFGTQDPRWMEREPSEWDVRDGELVLGAGAVERMTPMNVQPTVEALLARPQFAAENATVGVFVASKASTGIPLECFVEHHDTGDHLVMIVGDRATPIFTARETGLPPGLPRDNLRIYGSQLANFKIRCRARYGDNDGLFVDWDFWTSRVDFDTVGFRVRDATAAFRSLAIYTTAL